MGQCPVGTLGEVIKEDLPEEVICKPRPGNSGEVKRMQAEETTSKRPCEVNKTDMLENQKSGQCEEPEVRPE